MKQNKTSTDYEDYLESMAWHLAIISILRDHCISIHQQQTVAIEKNILKMATKL